LVIPDDVRMASSGLETLDVMKMAMSELGTPNIVKMTTLYEWTQDPDIVRMIVGVLIPNTKNKPYLINICLL
jgi:hypothetical protein